MKLTLLKVLMFTLYFTTLAFVWTTPGLFDGFSLLVVTFVLGYCGIIILSQMSTVLAELFHWCLAAKREAREEGFTASSVDLETETEAI